MPSNDQVSPAPKQLGWFFSQSPLLGRPPAGLSPDDAFPKSPIAFHVVTPKSSPMNQAVETMHSFFEEIGHLTRVDPQEAWLPITESRNGNAFCAAFHSLCSGIGFQALLLPLAFASLGWIWGITCLSLAFIWQLYTIWLLIQMHESENGTRYSRYLQLSKAAFGEKLGKLLSLFPVMYLSGGTCVALVMLGGGSLKIFYEILCEPCKENNPLTTLEWYMVFTAFAVILAQLPNLNSVARVSLIGSLTGVGYCTLIWSVSVYKDQPTGVSYGPTHVGSHAARFVEVLNAIGMIVLAFRGHNLVLEIQGTMPTSKNQPSRIAMWRGVMFAYAIIALCLFPVAIGGYWAYGNLIIPTNGGLLKVLYKYHGHDTSKFLLCLTSLLIVIHCLSSFQIYAMPVFDNLESRFTSKKNPWLRSGIRIFFGCLVVFIAFALPFLPSLAGLLGGLSLPLTLAYPCFMWIKIKKPREFSITWYLNWGLGCLGILLSIMLVTAAIWSIRIKRMPVHFFKPDERSVWQQNTGLMKNSTCRAL